MAKASGLTDIGNILALVGGIIMVIFGILEIVNSVASSLSSSLDTVTKYNYHLYNFGTGTLGGVIDGIILLVLGIVLIYIYKEKKAKSGDEILIFGIIYIVLGVLAWGIGGILSVIGGILLIIDFFI